MGRNEQKRAMVLNQVLSGLITVGEAALLLGRSPRQVQRLRAAYQARGPAALVHGNRGRTPVWTVPPAVAARIVALAQGPYAGFNLQHLTEMLADREGLVVSRSTVRRVLLGAGVVQGRPRRHVVRRQRRERMPQAGMLLQADGSPHHWLGPDGPSLTLIAMIDDATSAVLGAVFRAAHVARPGGMSVCHQCGAGGGVP